MKKSKQKIKFIQTNVLKTIAVAEWQIKRMESLNQEKKVLSQTALDVLYAMVV